MADYYSLISRAVAGLEQNTGKNRRMLYERARAALVAQLRSVQPALAEPDITRERLGLEDAIRKVEADAAGLAQPESQRSYTRMPAPPSLRDQAVRDFRATVAEIDGPNGGTAQAFQSAPGIEHAAQDRQPPAIAQSGSADRYYDSPKPKVPSFTVGSVASGTLVENTADLEAEDWQPQGLTADPDDEEATSEPKKRFRGPLMMIVVLLLVIGAIAGIGYWQRHTLSAMLTASHRSLPAPTPKQAATPPATHKIDDRIGLSKSTASSPASQRAANAPAAAVAQKVVLYEEEANNPQGKRYVGSAIWRTETVSPGRGLAPELAVRADVNVPERHMRMTWTLRRNTDKALPASHTIEIMFTLPADFPEGGIANVPGVLMKDSETARGVPLAGLSVKVTDGYFLIGLSATDADKQRNIELLKNRDWFDIPVVYTNGRRAILALEKGVSGKRAFQEAFQAWGE